jgi:acyl-CoA synthetase (AMP-forming)/AMP-acid ligase II
MLSTHSRLGGSLRLHDFLDHWARQRPDAEFAVHGEARLTYGQAHALANRLAHALIQAGLEPGDRFGILAKNCIEYALVYFAASKASVVPVPLNYRSAPAEWVFVLSDAEARLLIAGRAYVAAMNEVRSQVAGVLHWVALDGADTEWIDFHPWLQAQPDDDPPASDSDDADLYQMYTSGTTGQPKGAVLTQRSVVSNLLQIGTSAHRGPPGERSLVVGPMLHAGVVWSALAPVAWGGALFILEDFDASNVVNILDTQAIGYAALVPTILQACTGVEGAAERQFAALRLVHCGSAALAETTLRRARDIFKCDITQGYGLSESTAGATVMQPADTRRGLSDRPELLASVGRPLLGTTVRIVDEAGRPLPAGVTGEIVLRGPQLMRGYWKQARATADTLRGGWLRTGDVGRLDADGYLYIQDRLKDVIVSGGANVYPRMVERVLEDHPAVAEVVVIGVPDSHWGESVKSVVVLNEGLAATESELIDFCRDKLGGFQRPRSVDVVDALPRTASGKIMRRALREPYWQGRPRRVGQV